VEAITLAVSAGFTVVAIPAVIATRRLRGRAAVAGLGHATLAGIAAAAAAGAAGFVVTLLMPTGGNVVEVGSGFLAALVAVVVFGVVAYSLDRGDLRALAARLRRFMRGRT